MSGVRNLISVSVTGLTLYALLELHGMGSGLELFELVPSVQYIPPTLTKRTSLATSALSALISCRHALIL